MIKNKKIIYCGIALLIIAITFLAIYFTFFKCLSNPYIVTCHHQNFEETKRISCTSNKDCSIENMNSFCSPKHPNLLKCGRAKYYCDNGYCKGCDCRDLPK